MVWILFFDCPCILPSLCVYICTKCGIFDTDACKCVSYRCIINHYMYTNRCEYFLFQDMELDFVLDLHAHSSLQGVFVYGNTYDDVYRCENLFLFNVCLSVISRSSSICNNA